MSSSAPPGADPVPIILAEIAVRLADEGIPVRPIARALKRSSEDVRIILDEAVQLGKLIERPKEDWPPTGRRADHLPCVRGEKMDNEEIILNCVRRFKITRLQASFLATLLRNNEVTKDTLHRLIEQQRTTRLNKSDGVDETDPKMVDVVICNLRKRIKPFNIRINTIWACGYYIDPEQRQLVSSLITEYAEGALKEKANG